jgi:hypothetical protein
MIKEMNAYKLPLTDNNLVITYGGRALITKEVADLVGLSLSDHIETCGDRYGDNAPCESFISLSDNGSILAHFNVLSSVNIAVVASQIAFFWLEQMGLEHTEDTNVIYGNALRQFMEYLLAFQEEQTSEGLSEGTI